MWKKNVKKQKRATYTREEDEANPDMDLSSGSGSGEEKDDNTPYPFHDEATPSTAAHWPWKLHYSQQIYWNSENDLQDHPYEEEKEEGEEGEDWTDAHFWGTYTDRTFTGWGQDTSAQGAPIDIKSSGLGALQTKTQIAACLWSNMKTQTEEDQCPRSN